MKIKQAFIVIIGFAILIIVIAPSLEPPSNGGGNCVALHECKVFLLALEIVMEDKPNLTIRELLIENNDELRDFNKKRRLKFLVFNPDKPVKECKGPIIICTHEYDNVPQPTIRNLYKKNPAHAVGEIGKGGYLITPSEYNKIDKTNYVNLSQYQNKLLNDQTSARRPLH